KGTQTLSGAGSLVFGGSTANVVDSQGGVSSNPATLTIGSGITIQAGSGTLAGYYTSQNTDTIINNGTITIATGANFTIGGVNWDNNGTITAASGATVSLGGSFTMTTLGTFSATGATVRITGTLNSSGTTLTLRVPVMRTVAPVAEN